MSALTTYQQTQSPRAEELLAQHAPLVKRIAYHLLHRLPPSVQVDDLIQAGLLGLLDATRQYDPARGASFETYAGIRIRGAMLDEIRRHDWAPRSVHRKARAAAQALRELENQLGREVQDHEVAHTLGVTLEEYYATLCDSNSAKVLSLHDVLERDDASTPADATDPAQHLQTRDFARSLAEAIASLPERERLVLSLYYDDELNLREIGEVLGVGESRVSQIHAQAVIRLQARLQDWIGTQDNAD